MSVKLVEISRAPLVECIHRGDIAVVDHQGMLRGAAGDPETLTYFRSAAKPIQALEVVLSGAAGRYGLSDAELAVICSSHYGEEFHQAAVRSILSKAGLDQSALRCGSPRSIKTEYALETARRGLAAGPLVSDCSGKHAGMLAVCRHLGFDTASYELPGHPLQVRLRQLVAEVCDIDADRIVIGVDGCSVPVFGLPLRNMALGYARLADPRGLSVALHDAMATIFRAMNAHPEMVAGTPGPDPGSWGFCTELLRRSGGKLIAKLGAEGVYCVGVRDRGLGIALKIEDGNSRAIHPAMLQVLHDLCILSPEQLAALDGFWHKRNRNDHGAVVGEYRTVFTLATQQPYPKGT